MCVCVCSVLKIVYYNRSSDQNIFGADTTKSIVVYVHTNKYINICGRHLYIYNTIYTNTHTQVRHAAVASALYKEKKCFFFLIEIVCIFPYVSMRRCGERPHGDDAHKSRNIIVYFPYIARDICFNILHI